MRSPYDDILSNIRIPFFYIISGGSSIFAEMLQREPYLQGETDIGQLNIIFSKLGTPTEEEWPEMKFLPDYFTVPARPRPSMKKSFPDATDDATALLQIPVCPR